MFSFGNKKATRRREMKAAEAAGRRPKLDRRNASKNIDYEASFASTSSDESTSLRISRSLDYSPTAYSSQTSFRIGGSVEGEIELLCRSLGLSGPDDFAIPAAAWEASLKARSSSDIFPRSRLLFSDSLPPQPENPTPAVELPAAEAAVLSEDIGVRPAAEAAMLREEIRVGDDVPFLSPQPPDSGLFPPHVISGLAPPPSMTVPVDDRPSLTSDRADVPLLSREIGLRSTAEAAVLPEEIAVRYEEPTEISLKSAGRSYGGDGGIRGVRPPVLTPPPLPVSVLSSPPVRSILAPPPSMTLPLDDRSSSVWDLVRSFAPADESEEGDRRRSVSSDEEEGEEEEGEGEEEEEERVGSGGAGEVLEVERDVILGETSDGIGSFSTSNDDDSSSSTTTEYVISPNGRFKKKIKSWMRGQLIGSGSFGTVYEGISDDGTFIAVKEVSLLEKGSSAQQCILQLEQEIALLSQFEHENIVQYYGTDKEESKLFIFLELVTQGSIASTYQKYHLRDTQVSAYTRQILNGLNYLHERDVVHRDIKCANILVHANGSVKLADFGLAKEISKFNDLKSCKGSVYWMAPEVINPRKTYGRAADIWSLGCTVLEMLTRQIPFPNVEWQHAFYRIGRGDQPPIPSHLSKHAQDFIRQCTQVDPNSRPTAAQLLDHPFARRPPCNY